MKILHKPWAKKNQPKRVLFIRFQAFGDTLITLPYIKGYAEAYPDVIIDFYTRDEDKAIPQKNTYIRKVWVLKGKRNNKLQFIHAVFTLPLLLIERYDIIYDLQNSTISNLIRLSMRPSAWSSFDKFSANSAGKRTFQTIKSVGLDLFQPLFSENILLKKQGEEFLKPYNMRGLKLIVNPAGFFSSRNWPIQYYLEWARLILTHYNHDITFLFLGVERVEKKAVQFQQNFPKNTVNLVFKTTQVEAYSVIQNCDFILSEDSGLMHMAWTSGVPTLALFGSTRSDWSRPLGSHSKILHSGDLECGNCMLEICKYEDNRCLTRYTPNIVFKESIRLIKTK